MILFEIAAVCRQKTLLLMNKLLLGGSDFSSPLMWLRGNQSNQETLLCSAIKIKKTLLNTARYYSTGKHYHFNVEYFSYLRFRDILTAFMSSSSSLFIHTIIFFFPDKTYWFTEVLTRKNPCADLQVTVMFSI